jgi:DNA mismatch endonuclease (patch repair protein)
MTDVHEPEIRSYNMSQIKGKDTKPEMLVRRFLHSKGFRYRLHVKNLPGKPDIVLPKYKTVIFINGCFWHGHKGCKYFVMPKSRQYYWVPKIQNNIKKDIKHKKELKKLGWKVITVWECKLSKKYRNKTIVKLLTKIRQD